MKENRSKFRPNINIYWNCEKSLPQHKRLLKLRVFWHKRLLKLRVFWRGCRKTVGESPKKRRNLQFQCAYLFWTLPQPILEAIFSPLPTHSDPLSPLTNHIQLPSQPFSASFQTNFNPLPRPCQFSSQTFSIILQQHSELFASDLRDWKSTRAKTTWMSQNILSTKIHDFQPCSEFSAICVYV